MVFELILILYRSESNLRKTASQNLQDDPRYQRERELELLQKELEIQRAQHEEKLKHDRELHEQTMRQRREALELQKEELEMLRQRKEMGL